MFKLPRAAALSLAIAAFVFLAGVSEVHGQKSTDKLTDKAKKTQDALKSKVSVEFTDTILKEAVGELKEQVKGVFIQLDTKGGATKAVSGKNDSQSAPQVRAREHPHAQRQIDRRPQAHRQSVDPLQQRPDRRLHRSLTDAQPPRDPR